VASVGLENKFIQKMATTMYKMGYDMVRQRFPVCQNASALFPFISDPIPHSCLAGNGKQEAPLPTHASSRRDASG